MVISWLASRPALRDRGRYQPLRRSWRREGRMTPVCDLSCKQVDHVPPHHWHALTTRGHNTYKQGKDKAKIYIKKQFQVRSLIICLVFIIIKTAYLLSLPLAGLTVCYGLIFAAVYIYFKLVTQDIIKHWRGVAWVCEFYANILHWSVDTLLWRVTKFKIGTNNAATATMHLSICIQAQF